MGLRQCAGGLFWLGHFLCPLLFPPTHPPENPTRAARMQRPAHCHGTPTANYGQCNPCILAPRSTGRAVRAAYGRALIVCAVSPPARGRPLGGSRRRARRRRRTMRQDAGRAARAAPIGAPISPIAAPAGSGPAKKENPGAHPRPCPQKIQHSGHIGKPLCSFGRGVAGLANMARILGAGRGWLPRVGGGGSPKAPPPFPLPSHVGAGLSAISCSLGVLVWLAPSVARRAPIARAPSPSAPCVGSRGSCSVCDVLRRSGVAALLLPLRLLRVRSGGLPRGQCLRPSPCPLPPHPLPLARLPRALCRAPSGRVPLASPPPSRWRSIGGHPAASLRSAAYLKPLTPHLPLNHLN